MPHCLRVNFSAWKAKGSIIMRIKKNTNPYSKVIVAIDIHDYYDYMRGKIELENITTLITGESVHGDYYNSSVGYVTIVPDDDGEGFSLFEFDTVEDKIKKGSKIFADVVSYLVKSDDFTPEEQSRYADIMVWLNNKYPGSLGMCTKLADAGATVTKMMHYEMIGITYSGEVCPICELERYRKQFKQYLET